MWCSISWSGQRLKPTSGFCRRDIEEGEGHGEAALREVREEAGILARLSGLVMRVGLQDAG